MVEHSQTTSGVPFCGSRVSGGITSVRASGAGLTGTGVEAEVAEGWVALELCDLSGRVEVPLRYPVDVRRADTG